MRGADMVMFRSGDRAATDRLGLGNLEPSVDAMRSYHTTGVSISAGVTTLSLTRKLNTRDSEGSCSAARLLPTCCLPAARLMPACASTTFSGPSMC